MIRLLVPVLPLRIKRIPHQVVEPRQHKMKGPCPPRTHCLARCVLTLFKIFDKIFEWIPGSYRQIAHNLLFVALTWCCYFLLQQMPPSTQALRVLSENGRGRGTRGVLDWPYPTVLDRTSPGQQHSSEDVMRSDYLASHSGHRQRLNPSPTGKVYI